MTTGRKKLGRFLLAVAALFLVAWLLGPSLLQTYGRWLIVEDMDESGSVSAAVALSGADGERLGAAIELCRRGRAENLLIVGPDKPLLKVYTLEDSLTQGEAKQRIAIRKGVPEDAVHLALGATSTYEEAVVALEEATRRGWTSICVVTSPFHTRRARATFRSVFEDSAIEIRVYHLPPGESRQSHTKWWTRENDTMAVVTETMKLGYYIYRHRIWPWS